MSTVTASLDHASSVATTVTVSVAPDSPATEFGLHPQREQGADHSGGMQTASTGTVTVTAVDNDVDAADKTVQVRGERLEHASEITDPSMMWNVDAGRRRHARGEPVAHPVWMIDEGDSGTYTVMLDTEPTASVTVTPSRSSGDTDVTVSGALTFTTDELEQQPRR